MKFRHQCNTTRLNGLEESQVNEVEGDSIVIGRGGTSQLIFHSKVLSLEHARFTLREGKLWVEDLNSLSGVRVNDITVTQQVLKEGDSLKVADLVFTITRQDDVWGILESKQEGEEESSEAIIEKASKALLVSERFISMRSLSLVAVLAIIVLFFLLPLLNVNQSTWSSGPISNNHKMFEGNCAACHAEPFQPVQDEQCLSCHQLTDHAEALPQLVSANPHLGARCASCHMEHNGDHGIIATSSKLCTDCHANIKEINNKAVTLDVAGFANHPEFRVTLEDDVSRRISLDDKQNLKDPTHMKLNHKLHLEEGLKGKDGEVTLACSDCHQLTEDLRLVKPIQFEAHCSSCHPLNFDDRLPQQEVPHGDPDVVFNFIYAEYAKLYLASKEGGTLDEDFQIRRKPGYQQKVGSDHSKEKEFAMQVILAEARSAEKLLFTKTACHLCHDISQESGPDGNEKLANFQVLEPHIPEHWLPASVFRHGAHEEIRCESCHQGVRDSEETTDVLLPGISDCRACHSEEPKQGKVSSECILCHSYHDPLPLDHVGKKAIETIAGL